MHRTIATGSSRHTRASRSPAAVQGASKERTDRDSASDVLELQRLAGNQAVGQLLHRSGMNPSDIRVHKASDANDLTSGEGAAAYAKGRDVYLRRGIEPASDLGERVIVHELVHVIQQERGRAGWPIDADANLELEASVVSGIGPSGVPSRDVGAATPNSVQKLDEREVKALQDEELKKEWRRQHPRSGPATKPGSPGELSVVDEDAERAEEEAFNTWRTERLRQLGSQVKPWTQRTDTPQTPGERSSSAGLTDAEGRPLQGPVTLLPSEAFLPVVQSPKPAQSPAKRDLASEAKAAWEARTSPAEKAAAARRPPPRVFSGQHERAVRELSTMFDLVPGAKLGRNIGEFVEGEDVLGRPLDRREVSREISKEILLQVAPLMIPEGGLIGEGGSAEAPIVESELGEIAPILEDEGSTAVKAGSETAIDLPAAEPIDDVFEPIRTPAAEHPEGFLEGAEKFRGADKPTTATFSEDPRDVLSMEEQMQHTQFDPSINREADWRSAYRFAPEANETKTFGPRTYQYDAERNLTKASTTDLTLGVRDKTMYAGTPGMSPGEDYGHLLGVDFGNIDAQVGRYGGFRQASAINRPLGSQPALWYDAERTALDQALQLKQANQPFEVIAEARGYVNAVPAETRIYVKSGSGVVYDSGWIGNPVKP